MSYKDWFNKHSKKHRTIVDKLIKQNLSQDEIIDYFDFDNMKQNEIDFCPLYKQNKKCHNIKNLNCYLCACPNFRFNDNGIATYDNHKILSKCSINNGKQIGSKSGNIHQDCSSCTTPHHKSFIQKNFSLDWRSIMNRCQI